jgi:hypothetical protein
MQVKPTGVLLLCEVLDTYPVRRSDFVPFRGLIRANAEMLACLQKSPARARRQIRPLHGITRFEMSHSPSTQPGPVKSKRLPLFLLIGVVLVGAGEVARRWLHSTIDLPVAMRLDNTLVKSEGLILELTPRLKELLNTSVLNLTLPDALGVELFADRTTIQDITGDAPHEKQHLPGLKVRKYSWNIDSSPVTMKNEDVSLWRALFQSVDYFERASFKFVRGRFDDTDRELLHSDVAFEGLARDKDGRLLLVKAEQSLVWRAFPTTNMATPHASNDRASNAVASNEEASNEDESISVPVKQDAPANDEPTIAQWKIVEWTQKSLDTVLADQMFFAESLDRVIPNTQLRRQLRNSIHELHILDRYAALSKHEEWEGPHPYFSVVSQDRHPSLAVVDIDRDGLDDIYVMARWGKNVLLHNKGGYFEDVAPQYGLDIDSHCASAIFADFDNDGDVDLMLGRTLVPSQYLVNENGQFVDRSDTLVDGGLPSLVTSVSAADYNGDGLLDVYLSTYAANMQDDELKDNGPPLKNPDSEGLLSDFLPDDVSLRLMKHIGKKDYHRHLNNYGPPNLLLLNTGGRFETSPLNEQVAIWRHTYQASWSDYDQDGDPDLYLTNDFAGNSLMRNDGDAGFVDVAEASGTTDIGFGMGASWGDYDNDGRVDLYVSNMFSKAGRRITGSLQKIDPRFAMMARGNSLFHNKASGFQMVSDLEAPALQVEKAGWSWSGQFVDFDNDGWLDVHALSGYYSAPPEIAVQVDL